MRINNNSIKTLLGLENCFLSDCHIEEDPVSKESSLIFHVKPHKKFRCLCPHCGKQCPIYDRSHQQRLWRATDIGVMKCFIQGHSPRVTCSTHGVVTASVPWAFPQSSFTKYFDNDVAWFAVQAPKSAVAEYMRIDWETVGRCISRVRMAKEPDPRRRLKGLRKIGIDETSYKKGHKYLTVVVNHETNEVVYLAEGKGEKSLEGFFTSLTQEEREQIEAVSADGAGWIWTLVEKYLPQATKCIDAFHVIEWANAVIDELRRDAWREALKEGKKIRQDLEKARERLKKEKITELMRKRAENKISALRDRLPHVEDFAKKVKGALYSLVKGTEHLTEAQAKRRDAIAKANPTLNTAIQLKEELREIFKMKDEAQLAVILWDWTKRAMESEVKEIFKLGEKIRRHFEKILMTIGSGLSNARIEATNNKIKVLIRRSYGFRKIENLMDMIFLVCCKEKIKLAGR